MSHYVGRNIDFTKTVPTNGLTFLATDGYGRVITVGGSGTGAGGDITSAQLHTDLTSGTQKTMIVDPMGDIVSVVPTADGYAIETADQFAPVYEDSINGVAATVMKPIANSSYSLSNFSTTALAVSSILKASPGKLFSCSGMLVPTVTTLTGTSITLTNGATTLTGVGTAFDTQLVGEGKFVKIATHSEYCWVRVLSVTNSTTAVLASNYTGPTATATGHFIVPSTVYFQIHNTIAVPAEGSVPVFVQQINMVADSRPIDFKYDFVDNFGFYLNTGITMCLSSTLATKTLTVSGSQMWLQSRFV